jgi:hypothetical protein
MKIIEIVSDSSELTVSGVQRIAFRTDPPLTDPVWNKFCEGGYQDECWEKNDTLLIWIGDENLDASTLNETENRLSRIEGKLGLAQIKDQEDGQVADARAKAPTSNPKTDRKYLSKISKQTLRPIM